ncbi:Arylsulfatase A-like, partial [Homarus americanus]
MIMRTVFVCSLVMLVSGEVVRIPDERGMGVNIGEWGEDIERERTDDDGRREAGERERMDDDGRGEAEERERVNTGEWGEDIERDACECKQSLKVNKTRPNIIILLADDLGYGDLSYSGHPTSRTPHIDRLAANSRFFSQFYVTSPVCSPSRSSLLTGRVQVRSGVYPGVFTPDNTLGLPLNETTIASLLKDQYVGVPYSHDMCPCLQCFPGRQPCYDTCWHWDVSCPLFRNTTIVEQPVDLPSLHQRLVDHALAFIHKASSTKQPFFLYLPFHHVHHPQFASSKYHGRSERGRFGDALQELDGAIGQLMGYLRTLQLLPSTLVWFTSDNGPSMTRHERGGSAGPLRCGKGSTWEGGVRVPTFVHWQSHITPGLASTLDILPTLAAITNITTSHLTLDGVDISPLLLDPVAKSPRQLFAVYPAAPTQALGPFAVTNGTFKAHYYTKGSGCVREYQGVSGCVRVCQGVSGSVRVCQDVSGSVRMCQGVSGGVRGRQGGWRGGGLGGWTRWVEGGGPGGWRGSG